MENIISARNLSHTYCTGSDTVDALTGITFQVQKGDIFGFLGPNGAGKTTTIKLMLGILSPQKGEILVAGADPSIPSTRSKIGFLPETADYYPHLTPREILLFYGEICGVDKKVLSSRVNELIDMVGLGREKNRKLGTFSKGMKQKVSFTQALVNDPDLLVLDEPASGLDPIARKNMRDIILSLKKRGKTIFFSSHELSEVELICDSFAILNRGKVVANGRLSDFLNEKGEKQSLETYFIETIGRGQ